MTEHWKAVVGAEGSYEVSDLGRVVSLNYGKRKLLKIYYEKRGRQLVSICSGGKRRSAKVHLLVLTAFIGPRPDGLVGCHFNDDKTDNRLVNLRWDTPQENVSDAKRNGRYKTGAGCWNSHPPDVVARILKACASGMSVREASKEFRVSRVTIQDWVSGRTRKLEKQLLL